MALIPPHRRMVHAASERHRARPDTFIEDSRFHDLVDVLKQINEQDDEARDKAITEALLDVGGVAPESWREIYDKYGKK